MTEPSGIRARDIFCPICGRGLGLPCRESEDGRGYWHFWRLRTASMMSRQGMRSLGEKGMKDIGEGGEE